MKLTHASLFSGLGGSDIAAQWMGWENAFHSEINEFCNTILKYWFPYAEHYTDITKTDFRKWKGKIDVLTGGFPCQPFSLAGQRKGADDDRYLWPEMLRAIREIRPTWVIGENVAGILSMVQPGKEIEMGCQSSLFEEGNKETLLEQEFVTETICRDLEREGYSVQPFIIPACSVGAPHRRDRIWFIAHCPDTGTKEVWQKGKDGILSVGTLTHANGNDAGRCRYGEARCKAGKGEKEKREWEWIRNESERNGCEGIASNSKGKRLQGKSYKRIFQKEREKSINGKPLRIFCTTWKDFPTQSPVCGGNDGLPFNVDHLTIPYTKWRTESIKGYGNAIVPQVILEIFRAIEETYN